MEPIRDAEVTQLLEAWSAGDDRALDRLVPAVHGELRRLASHYLSRERRDHTLQTTALVNEAFLRVADQRSIDWKSRSQFVAIAARMMRRILVDHARARVVAKRGGDRAKISIERLSELAAPTSAEVLDVDEALEALAAYDRELADLVELRFFGGLTGHELAAALEVSVPTVGRRWRLAKAWLYRYLAGREERRRDRPEDDAQR